MPCEWEELTKDVVGFYHEVKIIYTLEGKKTSESYSFMTRLPPLDGIQTIGDGWRGLNFLTTPPNSVETWSSTRFLEQLGWMTNGKATLSEDYTF